MSHDFFTTLLFPAPLQGNILVSREPKVFPARIWAPRRPQKDVVSPTRTRRGGPNEMLVLPSALIT